ncbi:MAPEG family protein [Pseudodonghicola flavimaris]|uniref:MAPEG family protein n=1 Tax=Pseudodonghicola flavimaris TaxID=3050036 RepID=A0ABT7F0G0_9RHOB|nr:MAPEG family protein [Pseudodonghicola flavimaris]MDK3018079.1 MAPEG family protein [Pseudodonghicola flavimaris]
MPTIFPSITPIYAALIAVVFLALSARVITYRRRTAQTLGDHGDPALLARMRAQANCAEYAPIGLLLLLMIEMQGTPALAVQALGLALLLGRILHGLSFTDSRPRLPLRIAGIVLTLVMIGLSALALLTRALI